MMRFFFDYTSNDRSLYDYRGEDFPILGPRSTLHKRPRRF